jgi:hypothetical protein
MTIGQHADAPLLVLSQDYEFFFGVSGTAEKCLFEPCDALLAFGGKHDVRFTFYVDAGMLLCMQRHAAGNRQIGKVLGLIQRHIEQLAASGNEIGLHVHPHWEDTRWTSSGWDFSGTRYQLQQFSDGDAANIMRSYSHALGELSNTPITSYRAGGFCVEPFGQIRETLKDLGITIDSSVVPGAKLQDVAKGFDFSQSPDKGWWCFDSSPAVPSTAGEFCEVAITPLVLSIGHYWGRLVDRLKPGPSAAAIGDGVSKAIGKREIARRLLGAGRVSELSIDAAKAHHLGSPQVLSQRRNVWHVMGHPKLLGADSLTYLGHFIGALDVGRAMTVSEYAAFVRSDTTTAA